MKTNYPPLREQQCSNCRYCPENECRRHAPVAGLNLIGKAFWPEVERTDWCGEWAPQEAGQ
jgi:hypothetical protein